MRKCKLKPCPFCGEQPHLDRHDIFCDCGVKVDIPAWDNGENDFPTYEEAVQEMIDIWNTRTPDIEQVKTEAVKEFLASARRTAFDMPYICRWNKSN